MLKFFRGFMYAVKGIAVAVREQLNLKVHLLALAIVSVAGLYFQITAIEWAILFLVFGLVLVAEMLNTAIEYLVDFVSPEFHPTAGKIKDVAAGAVLISAIIAGAVGLLIFGNRFLNLLL
ncbi:MAG: diacylglycerol kinase family protein [Chitinophagales bacterium]|nr:diacylglycerol kinase family protein [Chitinophagales bacterium]